MYVKHLEQRPALSDSVCADGYHQNGRSPQEARDTLEHGSQPVLVWPLAPPLAWPWSPWPVTQSALDLGFTLGKMGQLLPSQDAVRLT